ncbi:helix-turn-helix domain-containing protein [Microtetraspora sp. NBRC 16547]|uniref:MarR family transcriptional regulator n=1 Tax=Microtetraspora sp. NBRC 16547 TaxID=3030993 RepID=UPI0024A387B2|nr:helix-turn-helix domain-containing protein [Microtetraspora sp. NBRC 16547]GLW98785.1 hypothetical protein Misp02_28720 [Microtetraspora sp. NBRC 16547]
MADRDAVLMAGETTPDTLTDGASNAAEFPYIADAAEDMGRSSDGRVEAVWGALIANPGTSATLLGAAVDMSRTAAGKILSGLEAEGRAVRTPGSHDGRKRTPDIWHPVIPDMEETAPAPESVGDQNMNLDDADAATPGPVEIVSEDLHTGDEADQDASADLHEVTGPEALTSSDSEGAALPVDDGAVTDAWGDQEPEIGGSARDHGPETDTPEIASATADPAWEQARRELMNLAEMLLGTVEAMDGGDIAGALGRLELLQADVSRVRRVARAVLTGPKRAVASSDAVPARPGQLRDRVLSHLKEHPGKDFTPYEIGRVLGSSSGAVANALDRLVSLGQAELTCERPRRFATA